jgi:hypothetical protein
MWLNSRGGLNEQRLAPLRRQFPAEDKFGPGSTLTSPGFGWARTVGYERLAVIGILAMLVHATGALPSRLLLRAEAWHPNASEKAPTGDFPAAQAEGAAAQ